MFILSEIIIHQLQIFPIISPHRNLLPANLEPIHVDDCSSSISSLRELHEAVAFSWESDIRSD
jgi:hypothetical protein